MEACCSALILIVVFFIAIQIILAISKARYEEYCRIENLTSHLDNQMENQKNILKAQEDSIINSIKNFFSSTSNSGNTSYESIYNSLTSTITDMQSTISQMQEINEQLVEEARKEDQSAAISQAEERTVFQAKHIIEGFETFGKKVYSLSSSKMIDEKSYGKINKAYWDSVCAMKRDDAVSYISSCEYLLGSTQFDELYAIDIEKVVKCVWFFAVEKTFSASDFQKAENVFSRIYKHSHADLIIADLYAKKKMGGEDILRDPVRNLLKIQGDSHILTLIASGLMWMNAYQTEHAVLQHMLATGKEMTVKTQERLHSLTNGGGKAPSGFDVKSSTNFLYFDVSALAWKDDDYIGLFENLAFQDKALAYSLALRDENKDLFIPHGINVPNTSIILNKFKSVFEEEYGSGVVTQAINCIALSGSGEEKIDGILVSSNECKQMGILIHIARIGKKLIIRFYTLFMPTSSDLAAQKQQALSMYKKLSPTVTMWESSLKDTMLMAVEQLLNTNTKDSVGLNVPDVPDNPIF